MAKEKLHFRDMMAELTQLLSDMQSEELDVDEALQKHARGKELIQKLTEYLDTAENSITVHKAG